MNNIFERIKLRFNTSDRNIANKLNLKLEDYYKIKNDEVEIDDDLKKLIKKKYFIDANNKKNNAEISNIELFSSMVLNATLFSSLFVALLYAIAIIFNYYNYVTIFIEITFGFCLIFAPYIVAISIISLIIFRKYFLAYFHIIPIVILIPHIIYFIIISL